MGILKGIFKARDKPKDALGGGRYSFFFGGTTAGKPVNEHTAMQMTAVYSCVRILAETVAGLPLHIYQYNDSGGKEKYIKHPLSDELSAAADKLQKIAPIDEAEASGVLAKYVAEIIEKGLDVLRDSGGNLHDQMARILCNKRNYGWLL